ncbi:MAG: class II aldolase/adducin family protein [Chloroflexi bacterium]|nr:class II aldolase/adducin family protein [Chloroflexota bacterium]
MIETELRAEIVRIGRLMHQFEFVDGASGNLSARVAPGRILATPSGLAKGFLQPDQLLVLDLDGNVVPPTPPGLQPTSELLMHLEAYRRRPDVNGVIHAHPITSVALSVAGVALTDCTIPEAVVILGPIPTTPYATPSSVENQHAISQLVKTHDAIILAYHGTLTVGPTLWDAYLKLETLEHTAKIVALARMLGGAVPLPPEQVSKLLDMRRQWGFARATDADEFCRYCDTPHPPGRHLSEEALVQAIAAEVKSAIGNLKS